MAKNRNLIKQVNDRLKGMAVFDQKNGKYEDKLNNVDQTEKIYSISTLRSYIKQSCEFTKWIRQEHPDVKTLDQAREYAGDYIKYCQQRGDSVYSLKLYRAALAKMYGVPCREIAELPNRQRADIERSRGAKISDYHFNPERHPDFVSFCRATGLRRAEITALKGSALIYRGADPYLSVIGKGDRHRYIPILPTDRELVERYCRQAGDGKVWPHVPSHADIHGYRADYARKIYNSVARPPEQLLAKDDRYVCRKDRGGIVLDRKAMAYASEALGHNRINVIAQNYI